MKEEHQRILLALSIIFLSLAVVNFVFVYNYVISAKVAYGSLAFCVNRPPTISMDCPIVGVSLERYYCRVYGTDPDSNASITFLDNTSLFNITVYTGAIDFIPQPHQGGNHSIKISVEDSSICENRITSAILNITIRADAMPSVNISPVTSPTRSSTIRVSGNYSDDYGVVSVKVNGNPANISGFNSQSGTFNGTVTLIFEGNQTINVTATDNVGKKQSAVTSVVYDTSPPSVLLDRYGSISSLTGYVSGRVSDTHSSVHNVTVYMGNQTLTAVLANGAFNETVSLANGWNIYYVYARDKAGNFINVSSGEQGASIYVDSVPPKIELLSHANNSLVYNGSFIEFRVSDISPFNTTFRLNNGPVQPLINSRVPVNNSWVDAATNSLAVNATDSLQNSQVILFSFKHNNSFASIFNSSIDTVKNYVESINTSLANLTSGAELEKTLNDSGITIPVAEYNKTIELLNVGGNISKSIEQLNVVIGALSDINSLNVSDDEKANLTKAKLEEIEVIKNNTVVAVAVRSFTPEIKEAAANITESSNMIASIAASSGLSQAQLDFLNSSASDIKASTNITSSSTVVSQKMLNGREENFTVMSTKVNKTSGSALDVIQDVNKNMTGTYNGTANTGLVAFEDQSNPGNRIFNKATVGKYKVIVSDPLVSWKFSGSEDASVDYMLKGEVTVEKASSSKVIVLDLSSVPVSSSAQAAASSDSGGGGGGGGGGIKKAALTSFFIDRSNIQVSMNPGEAVHKSIIITNDGEVPLKLKLSIMGSRFVFLSEENFILKPNESREIGLDIVVRDDQQPGSFVAELVVESGSLKKEVLIHIDVSSKAALFDVSVRVPEKFKKVFAGDEILATIKLFNLGLIKRADVTITYSVLFPNNSIAVFRSKTVAVETQLSLVESLQLPRDLLPGDYVFSAEAVYNNNSMASGSDVFTVLGRVTTEEKLEKVLEDMSLFRKTILFIVLIILIVIVFIGVHIYRSRIIHEQEKKARIAGKRARQLSKQLSRSILNIPEKPLAEKPIAGKPATRHALEKKLILLQEDFDNEIITEETYRKAKERVIEQLHRMEKEENE